MALTNESEEEQRRRIAALPDPNDPAVLAAAVRLQSAGRGHLARVAAANLRAEHAELQRLDRAATLIQAAVKGWKDRVMVRRKRIDIAHAQETCVCNKPPRGKMAMCSECYELCHLTCVGLPTSGSDWRVALGGEPFVCPRCTRVAAVAAAAEREGRDPGAAAAAQRRRTEAVFIHRRATTALPPGVALTRIRARDEKDIRMLGLLGVELVNRGDAGGGVSKGKGFLNELENRLLTSSLDEKLKETVSSRLARVRSARGMREAQAGARKIDAQVAMMAREAGGQPSAAVPPQAVLPMLTGTATKPPIVNVAPPPTPPKAGETAKMSAAEALRKQEEQMRNRKIVMMEREAEALKEREEALAKELEQAKAMAEAMEKEAQAAMAREAKARAAVQERFTSSAAPSGPPTAAPPAPRAPPPRANPPPLPPPVLRAAAPPAPPPGPEVPPVSSAERATSGPSSAQPAPPAPPPAPPPLPGLGDPPAVPQPPPPGLNKAPSTRFGSKAPPRRRTSAATGGNEGDATVAEDAVEGGEKKKRPTRRK